MSTLEKTTSIEAGLQTIVTPDDALNDDHKKVQPEISLCAKARLIITNISVEPIMICYVLPSVMASLATQNLNLEKACRVNLHLNTTICDALQVRDSSGYNATDEIAVQSLVATMNAIKNVIQSVIPAMLLLFLGSWSDRHQRRKPCILLPLSAEVVTVCGFLLCTYFFYELRMEYNVFFESVPPALTGGWFGMFMGIFSYISGVSTVEARTLRIGAVNLIANISITIGIALSGILYKKVGFYGVFSSSLTLYICGLLYGWFFVKEKPLKVEDEEGDPKNLGKSKSFLVDFFNFQHIGDTFRVAFKEGARNRKKRICTMMVLVMVIIGPMHGEMTVAYLFVRRKFGWNEVDYSLYSTFHFVFHLLGTIFSLSFFTKFLKVDDAVLGMISCCSKVAACFFYAFASTPTLYYVGAVVEFLNGTSFIAMRSIVSKLVPPDELGQINSLFGVSEALMPLLYGPMYSWVYKRTIGTLPGAFFLVGGALTTPAIFIFLWLYYEHKYDKKLDAKEKALKEAEGEKLLNNGSKTTANDNAKTEVELK